MSRKRKTCGDKADEGSRPTKQAKVDLLSKPLAKGGNSDIWYESQTTVIKHIRTNKPNYGIDESVLVEMAAHRYLGMPLLGIRFDKNRPSPGLVLPRWIPLTQHEPVWKLESEEALQWLAWDLLTQIAEAHSQGLVHGDIAAENVMLEESTHKSSAKGSARMQARLIDWGSAIFLSCSHSQLNGRHDYRAPEAWLPEPVEPQYRTAQDIWAFGYLLLYCILGKYPANLSLKMIATLESNSTVARRNRHQALTNMVQGLASLLEDKPPKLARFCTAILTVEPGQRPTAAKLLQHEWLAACPKNKPDKKIKQTLQGICPSTQLKPSKHAHKLDCSVIILAHCLSSVRPPCEHIVANAKGLCRKLADKVEKKGLWEHVAIALATLWISDKLLAATCPNIHHYLTASHSAVQRAAEHLKEPIPKDAWTTTQKLLELEQWIVETLHGHLFVV